MCKSNWFELSFVPSSIALLNTQPIILLYHSIPQHMKQTLFLALDHILLFTTYYLMIFGLFMSFYESSVALVFIAI